MNPETILDQLLGPDAAKAARGTLQGAGDRLAGSSLGGFGGGMAAGGLLGVLLGSKKARKTVGKLAGGVVGYGAAAALGALAFRAYQNWQAGRSAPQAPTAGADDMPAEDSRFLPSAAPATDGRPFELALVKAMIAAANADGHIGPDEQRVIFDKVGTLPLDAEDKAFVFDALAKPPSLAEIAGLARGQEQAAELWLASRLAIDPDHPMEQAWLEGLASRLGLPADLVAHLEGQVAAAAVDERLPAQG